MLKSCIAAQASIDLWVWCAIVPSAPLQPHWGGRSMVLLLAVVAQCTDQQHGRDSKNCCGRCCSSCGDVMNVLISPQCMGDRLSEVCQALLSEVCQALLMLQRQQSDGQM